MKEYLKEKRLYIILICLFFFLLLAILVLKNGVLDIDRNSYVFIKENLINDNLTTIIKLFTYLGGAVILIIISLMIALFVKDNIRYFN